MALFHFSYDISNGSVTISQIVRFLCQDEDCMISAHPVESTFIFECATKQMQDLEQDLRANFADDFYFVLSEIKGLNYCSKQSPTIEGDYKNQCKMFRQMK